MPCYKCGRRFNEPVEVCTGCSIHLVRNGMKCIDYKECVNDNDKDNKKCDDRDCEKCIIYKGCGTICKITEPPVFHDYNYPDCYCACTYTELRNRLDGRHKLMKPKPYYATCHACCPIYDMCCLNYTNHPNADMKVVGKICHIPPLREFRYDYMYEDALTLDRSCDKEDKDSKSIFHGRVAKKKWIEKDNEWKVKRAQERSDWQSNAMAIGLTSYDSNNYDAYRHANSSYINTNAHITNNINTTSNVNIKPDFSILRSK